MNDSRTRKIKLRYNETLLTARFAFKTDSKIGWLVDYGAATTVMYLRWKISTKIITQCCEKEYQYSIIAFFMSKNNNKQHLL